MSTKLAEEELGFYDEAEIIASKNGRNGSLINVKLYHQKVNSDAIFMRDSAIILGQLYIYETSICTCDGRWGY